MKLDKTPPTVDAPADAARGHERVVQPRRRLHGRGFGCPLRRGRVRLRPSYDGPDSAHATVTVACLDRAGHRGTGNLGFMYDDTAPTVRAALATSAGPVRLVREGRSRLLRRERRGLRHRRAARRASTGARTRPEPPSRAGAVIARETRAPSRARSSSPSPSWSPSAERVTSPPLLDWVDVRRAREYNLQVWHDGRKILSRWPDASRWQLGRRWTYQGETHGAEAGRALPGVRLATLQERLRRAARARADSRSSGARPQA